MKKNIFPNMYSDEYPYLIRERPINITTIIQLIQKFKPVIWNAKDISNKMTVRQRSTIHSYEDGQLVIYDDWNKTQHINNITDLFSESVRVKCNFKNNPSPLVYWNNNKSTILKIVQPNTIHNLREYLFFNTKLCNNFRITVSLAILNIFKHNIYNFIKI